MQGRLLHVLPAKAPSGSTGFSVEEGAGAAAATGAATATAAGAGAQGEGGAAAGAGAARSAAGSSYKATLEEKRRADAGARALPHAMLTFGLAASRPSQTPLAAAALA